MSEAGDWILKAAVCTLGVFLSIISHSVGKLGSKFLSNYYTYHPSTIILTGKDVYTDPDHTKGILLGYAASQIASKLVSVFVPGVCGVILSSFAAFAVGEAVTYFVNKYTDSRRACTGISQHGSPGGSGGPGGVEFRKMKPLTGFNEAEIILSRQCNLFFETDNEKSTREAFNAICLPNFRNRTMKEYFETIMAEISQSTFNGVDLPFISLHFNKNGILYSVMNPVYKQTLIGNTLTFLDYFLKGFVNGGFFTIDFVRKWKSNQIVDLDILNQSLIDVRKKLKKIRSGYQSLYSLLDQNKYGDEFTSAFRIVGEISNVCQMSGQTFLPNSGFVVESDLCASPSFQNIMNTDPEAHDKWIKITVAHNRMKYLVHNLMPLVPEFTGYFEILKMICFALHYSESLNSVGLKAETNSAFQNSSSQYVEIIPETFPPLPVRESIKLDPKITYGDVLDTISSSSFDQSVNQLMEKKISESTEDSIIMKEKIRQMYMEKINKQAASHNFRLDDDDIELDTFMMTSMNLIHTLKHAFESIFLSFYTSIINQMKEYFGIDNNEVKRKLSNTELGYFNVDENNSTNPQLRKQCCNIFELAQNQQFIEKLIPDSYLQATAQFKESIINLFKQEITKNIEVFKNKYDEFDNYYHHPSQINKKYCKFFDKVIDWTISISIPKIQNEQNSTSIRGGCLVRSQKSCNIINQKLSIEDENKIQESTRNGKDFAILHDKKGFLVDLKLQSYKYSIEPSSESKEKESMERFLHKNGFTLDNLQLYSGIADSSLSNMDLKHLDITTTNGISNASLSCIIGSINAIDLLINKGLDFGKAQFDGTYPFLEVMANEKHDAAFHILSKNAIINDINGCTETGVTPLHWSVYYGWNDITEMLISREASTTKTLRSNGMTPVHLACFHDHPKCLSALMKAPDCSLDKSLSGLTPFHVASAHSFSCAMLLIQNEKNDINVKDSNNHTARDIAILNGQYEIAKNIDAKSQSITFDVKCNELKATNYIFDFQSLCRAFSTGNVNMTETILKKMRNLHKINMNEDNEKLLIECACKGRCTEFVELLSSLIPLEKYPIAIDAARNGIANWLNDLKKYGADFSVNEYGLLDEAIMNGDDKFLEDALDIIDNIPETVWQRIINMSAKINDYNIIQTLAKCLHCNEKYSNIHLHAKDVITPKTNIFVIICFEKFILPESIDKLSDYIDLMSIPFLQFLIKHRRFDNSEVKKAIIRTFNNNDLDATYIILNEYPSFSTELCQGMPKLKKLSTENFLKAKDQIKNLLQITNEKKKINELNRIMQTTFNIGSLEVVDNFSLLEIAGLDLSYFWILKCLPKKSILQYSFGRNFQFSNKFLFSIDISYAFTVIFEVFEKASKNNAGSLLLNSLRKLDFDGLDEQHFGDVFISLLLEVMMKNNKVQYIKSVDDENQTMFHIAAKFRNINETTLKLLKEKIKKAQKSWKELLKVRTRKVKTISMVFASRGNFKAIKMLNELGGDIETRDIYGNNILHEIIKDPKMTNDEIINSVINIGNDHRELIIQRNRNGKNAFYLAAKRGFNGILGVFSMFYPASFLDNLDENSTKSALHVAAKKNQHETVRYLVQTLHLDLNIKTNDYLGRMPIHFAAMKSSIEAFKEIIKLGGNPLAEDSTGKNAFYYAFANGSNFMISTVEKMPSFLYEISSPKLLIPIVQNSEASSLFTRLIHLIDPSATRSCDKDGKTLLALAAEHNNCKIVEQLLILGIDPTKPANNGRNPIHICAEKNAIGCSTLIIKFLLLTRGSNEVNKILNSPDDKGDLPIHIAARNGFNGFVAHLLSSSSEIDLEKANFEGQNPFSLAEKYGHNEVSTLLENYHAKKSSSLIDKIKKIEEEEYQIRKIELKKTTYTEGTIINSFTTEMKKLQIRIDENLLEKFFQVFNNIFFIAKLYNLANDKKTSIVNQILDQMSKIKPKMINLIAYIIIFPNLEENEIQDFISIIDKLNKIKINKSHPIFKWIVNGLISAMELKEPNKSVIPSITAIADFASRVYNNPRLRRTIKYPCLPLPIHTVIPWLMSLTDTWLQVQLQFMEKMKITALFEKEPKLAIDFCNRLDYKQYKLVNYIMNSVNKADHLDPTINFKEYVIHSVQATLELYEDSDLQDNVRDMLIDKCIELSEKDMFDAKSLTKWTSLTRRVIDDFGLEYLIDILKVIPQDKIKHANYALSLIIDIGSPEKVPLSLIKRGIKVLKKKLNEIEKEKYVENRNLDEILDAFKKKSKEFIPYKFAFDGVPVVELSQSDRDQLRQFGQLLEKEEQIQGSIIPAAQHAGKKFRDNPSIENAAHLIRIIRLAIQDTMNLKPFTIQCLAVGALLLHRVNHPAGLKGRIAQIATGEGKSIIVAMLSASIALTGSFVDVISSSSYLAKRDAEKFEEFYDKVGLKCGALNENDQAPNVDYHVIYSTNTGFEFAFLREGISGKDTLIAVPFDKNVHVKRKPMTTIVDEADSLFIDTVTNSARIASGSSNALTWIFKPFFNAVIENKITNVIQARNFLYSIAQTQNEKDSLTDVSDHQLTRWIANANRANFMLKKDVDYVVGFNNDTQQYEIQIVDQENTGRINIGSRWCEGLHEFVEVKENLQVQPQSLTIAAVSHPSFFDRYQEIYGLTGTIGEEAERNEIKNVYKVDTFDVPPNRVCQRKRNETLIVSTDDEKHELIIEKIREITKQKRPILVIVLTISESQQLSEKLHSRNIKHFLLNDVQVEDEDYIIDRAGKCGTVTIATNTAGRGTDIRLEKMAVECGGLHVIIAFFPVNLRVECQNLGRAGRQGQPGSCQIIFSSKIYAQPQAIASDEILKMIYDFRTERIRKLSKQRLVFVQKEHLIFDVLVKYFKYYRQMRLFLESPQGEKLIRNNGGEKLGNNYDSESILSDLSTKWSQFYTRLSNGEIKLNDNLFEYFKNQYEQKMTVLANAFKDCIQKDDSIINISNSYSIDKSPSPSNSLDVDKTCEKSIKGFSGSYPIQRNNKSRRKTINYSSKKNVK